MWTKNSLVTIPKIRQSNKACHTQELRGLKQAMNELPPRKDQSVSEDDAPQHSLDNMHSFPSWREIQRILFYILTRKWEIRWTKKKNSIIFITLLNLQLKILCSTNINSWDPYQSNTLPQGKRLYVYVNRRDRNQ